MEEDDVEEEIDFDPWDGEGKEPEAAPITDGQLIIELPSLKPTAEQEAALAAIDAFLDDPKQKSIALTGCAGSGKSMSLFFLYEKLRGKRNSIWAAMTGKAAQRLRSFGIYAKTLHGTLYEPPTVDWNTLDFSEIADPPDPGTVLVIDEASMMTPKIWDDLDEWERVGVKIILVGDPFQLPPIIAPKEAERYGEDYSIFREVHGPSLRTVMRSVGPIIEVATHLREKRVMPRDSRGDDYRYVIDRNPLARAVGDYLDDPNDHMLITWKNEVRMQANLMVRQQYGLGQAIAKNEPILVRKNGQGLLNGDILKVEDARLGPKVGKVQTVYLKFGGVDRDILTCAAGSKMPMDGGQPNLPSKSDYWDYRKGLEKLELPEPVPITYGYCRTCHMGQGDQARRVTVFLTREDLASFPFMRLTTLPDGSKVPFGVRWLYTAVTRAKERLTIITD